MLGDLFEEEVGGLMVWGGRGREQSGRWGGADDRGPWRTERDERRRSLSVSHRIAVVATSQAARRHVEGGIRIMDPGEPTA